VTGDPSMFERVVAEALHDKECGCGEAHSPAVDAVRLQRARDIFHSLATSDEIRRALVAAGTAGVVEQWALFRSPRSGGTELVPSEYEEVVATAADAILAALRPDPS